MIEGPVVTIRNGCNLICLEIVAGSAYPSEMAAGSVLHGATLSALTSGASPCLPLARTRSTPAGTADLTPLTLGMLLLVRRMGDKRRRGWVTSARIDVSSYNGCAAMPAREAETKRELMRRLVTTVDEERNRGVPVPTQVATPGVRQILARALADCTLLAAAPAPPSTTR